MGYIGSDRPRLTWPAQDLLRRARGGRGVDARGLRDALHGPHVEVDVVRVEIVPPTSTRVDSKSLSQSPVPPPFNPFPWARDVRGDARLRCSTRDSTQSSSAPFRKGLGSLEHLELALRRVPQARQHLWAPHGPDDLEEARRGGGARERRPHGLREGTQLHLLRGHQTWRETAKQGSKRLKTPSKNI